MKVSSISVKDVLGIQEMRVSCGKVTTVSGGNATGKSSLLEAIKATLGRGALGRLARFGTDEEPETVLVLDDGAYRVERSAKKTRVKKRVGDSAAYEDVPRGQSFLDSLFDAQLSNPVSFLTAKPGDRVDLLLEALPIEIDWDALPKKLGAWPEGFEVSAVSGLHPLVGLALVREALFSERTGVNRSQKDKAASAYELKKSIPAAPAEAVEDAIQEAEAKLNSLRETEAGREAAISAREGTLRAEFKAEAAKLRKASEAKQAEVRAAAERECMALEKKCNEEVQTLQEATQADMDHAEEEATPEGDALRTKIVDQAADLATLREQAKRATQDAESRRLAQKFEAEAEALEADSGKLTQGIDNLDATRRALATDLPIEGLEVRGKDIYIDDIPYDQVNTSRKIRLAVQIATLRAKDQELPVLFVDGAEALDKDQFALLVKELEKSPAQVFLARVDEGPLSVEAS